MNRKLMPSLALMSAVVLGGTLQARADGLYSGTNLDHLIQVANWFTTVQEQNPLSSDLGGIRTDEGVDNFYQSDTGKAVFTWSTVRKLTGNTAYDAAIADAWTYTD